MTTALISNQNRNPSVEHLGARQVKMPTDAEIEAYIRSFAHTKLMAPGVTFIREFWTLYGEWPTCKQSSRRSISYKAGGRLHRDDGPAQIIRNGTQRWFQHGRLHCASGPAIIYPDGGVEWWLSGRRLEGVDEWIVDDCLPHWTDWTDNEVILFVMRWSD